MNCQGHSQNNEGESVVQQQAQAADRCSTAEKSETESIAAAGLEKECPIYRESAVVVQKVCEHYQPAAVKCPILGARQKQEAAQEQKMAQEWQAARELEEARKWREYQCPSHAPLYQNQLKAGEQSVDEEVEDGLLV